MKASLFFNNKKYILVKEASSLTGYSKDYIGQLARGNKINSKKIYGVWYVEEESIFNYKDFLNKSGLLPDIAEKIDIEQKTESTFLSILSITKKLVPFTIGILFIVGISP